MSVLKVIKTTRLKDRYLNADQSVETELLLGSLKSVTIRTHFQRMGVIKTVKNNLALIVEQWNQVNAFWY